MLDVRGRGVLVAAIAILARGMVLEGLKRKTYYDKGLCHQEIRELRTA